MTRVTLTPLERWPDAGPDFDRVAAETVYKAMAALPEGESQLFGVLLLDGCNHHEFMSHYVDIAEAAGAQAAHRAELLRKHYSREAVAKQRRGEDNTRELHYLVEIGKAFPFSFGQRSQYSKENARNRTRVQGRFAAEHRPIHTSEAFTPHDEKAAKDALGIPSTNGKLTGQSLSHYQQAYQQIHEMLHSYRDPRLNAMLHMQIEEQSGEQREHVMPVDNGKTPKIGNVLNPGAKIRSAAVSLQPIVSMQGAMVTGMHAMGAPVPTAAGWAGGVAGVTDVTDRGAFHRFVETSGAEFKGNEPYSATARGFGHLERGTRLLQEGLGENAPLKLRYALAVANHVGQFGPEAQKVLGPIADRTAYRYRGTERAPDKGLKAAFASLPGNARQRREVALFGSEPRGSLVTRTESGALRPTDPDRPVGWYPGPVLDYWREHLPNPDLNELQRKSGVVPPSEGVLISRGGEVMHQAIGYADDWYLPFNLRHLTALKGGEYIRTRTFGGPTTEDIYTGLVAGAKSITVVSHNGVYNITFDRNLRGGRRLNDKAARMVGRYGHLLDALKSQQVARGGISPSRIAEIRDKIQADTRMDPKSDAYKREFDRRIAAEKTDPVMSKKERNDAARAWLADAAGRRDSPKGYQTTQEMYDDVIAIEARREAAIDAQWTSTPPFTKKEYEQRAAERLIIPGDEETTAANVARVLGGRAGESHERWMRKAEQENFDRVHPLSLNGKGYDDALHALQEQFPYYIESVKYRPWTEAVGLEDSQHRGAKDTGYVLPRHNRPMEAQAGYFSADVYGAARGGGNSGKVRADTTRYQNRRVHQGQPKPPVGVSTGNPAGAAGGAGGGAAAGAVPAQPQVNPQAAQMSADFEMLRELHRQTHFEPGAQVHGQQAGQFADVGRAEIRREIQDTRFPTHGQYGALKEIYGRQPDDLEAMLADPRQAPKVRGWMDQVLGLAQGDKPLISPASSVVTNYRNKGIAGPPKDVPDTVFGRLTELDDDHNFPGVEGGAYYDANVPTASYVKETYDGDPLIEGLRKNKMLGDLDVDDKEWDAKVRSAKSTIRNAAMRLAGQAGFGGGGNVDAEERLDRDSLGLLRATQLRRNYVRALRREPSPEAPAAEADPYTDVSYHLHLPPGDPSDPTYTAAALGAIKAIPLRPTGTTP